MLDLNKYLENIKEYDYAITKIDCPYVPKNFPNTYAIGKDLDIFVSKNDFNNLIEITKKFSHEYKNYFEIRILKKLNNFRIRLENNKKLHFQIDITVNNEIIKNKILINNCYYILSLENEIKIRKQEIKANPKKIHHKIWLDNHLKNNSALSQSS